MARCAIARGAAGGRRRELAARQQPQQRRRAECGCGQRTPPEPDRPRNAGSCGCAWRRSRAAACGRGVGPSTSALRPWSRLRTTTSRLGRWDAQPSPCRSNVLGPSRLSDTMPHLAAWRRHIVRNLQVMAPTHTHELRWTVRPGRLLQHVDRLRDVPRKLTAGD